MDRNYQSATLNMFPSALSEWRGSADQRSLGARLRYAKRQTVYQSGEAASRVFEVLGGALIVFKLMRDGRRQIVEVVQR